MNKGFWGLLALLMTLSGNAYAYLDPGTGSMLMQSLIGAIAAAGMAMTVFWERIKATFYKLTGKVQQEQDKDESET